MLFRSGYVVGFISGESKRAGASGCVYIPGSGSPCDVGLVNSPRTREFQFGSLQFCASPGGIQV